MASARGSLFSEASGSEADRSETPAASWTLKEVEEYCLKHGKEHKGRAWEVPYPARDDTFLIDLEKSDRFQVAARYLGKVLQPSQTPSAISFRPVPFAGASSSTPAPGQTYSVLVNPDGKLKVVPFDKSTIIISTKPSSSKHNLASAVETARRASSIKANERTSLGSTAPTSPKLAITDSYRPTLPSRTTATSSSSSQDSLGTVGTAEQGKSVQGTPAAEDDEDFFQVTGARLSASPRKPDVRRASVLAAPAPQYEVIEIDSDEENVVWASPNKGKTPTKLSRPRSISPEIPPHSDAQHGPESQDTRPAKKAKLSGVPDWLSPDSVDKTNRYRQFDATERDKKMAMRLSHQFPLPSISGAMARASNRVATPT